MSILMQVDALAIEALFSQGVPRKASLIFPGAGIIAPESIYKTPALTNLILKEINNFITLNRLLNFKES